MTGTIPPDPARPGPDAAPGRARLALGLAAVVVATLPLGTVYAYSVFLRPLEAELGLTRAALSFVFGTAVLAFTIGMNCGPLLYRLAPPWLPVAACLATAAAGMALAATAEGVAQLALGYGVLFGWGGGAGYALLLQGMNLLLDAARAGRRGLVNGFIVSLYPLGAMIGAPLFGWAIAGWGLRPTLWGLGAALAVAGAVACLLLARAGMRFRRADGAAAPEARPPAPRGVFARLWLVFFLAAAAGLTVLGQAHAMVMAYGGAAGLALAATTGITACIAAARIGGGLLADRFAAPVVMAGAHVLALAGDLALLALPGPLVAVATLAMIGMGYGLISGSTAAAIGTYWGAARYGRIAARLYVAWCAAALTLPVVAGWLFDRTGGYGQAILIAAAANGAGILVAAGLPRRGHPAGDDAAAGHAGGGGDAAAGHAGGAGDAAAGRPGA